MTSSPGSYDEEPFASMTEAGTPADAYRIRPASGGARPSVHTSVRSSARWIAPGEHVEIDGIAVEGGFFYTGDVQRSHTDSIEACVIDARFDLAREGADPTDSLGSTALSYGGLTPAQRRTYVEWLASDRRKSDLHTGYLFFYLYGLERRVLVDGAAGKVSGDEFNAIAKELRRLLNLDANYAWQKHVRGLLDALSLMASRHTRMYLQPAPDGLATGYQVPLNVRVAFGQAALDQHPLPADWALAWVKLDPMMVRRTAVARCPEEFDRVFMRQYRERFGDGMILPANRTKLDASPQPSFRALKNVPVPGFLVGLPDIAAVNGTRNKLQLLMHESAAALDAYSRYLGRYPEAQGTLEATLMLPANMWPQATHDAIDALADEIGYGTTVSTFGAVLARFRSGGKMTRDKAVVFTTALAEAGIAVEPDVRLGARTPKPTDAVALFAIEPDAAPLHTDDAYDVATIIVDLAATVARADGDATQRETAVIEWQIEQWPHLSARQRARLKARNLVQLAQPTAAAGLKKKLEPLSQDVKATIASFLVHTANADGVVSRDEVRLLEKVYRMLGIDPQRLYTDLHQHASGAPASASVAGAKTRAHKHADTQKHAAPKAAFALDATRIAALKEETARVSSMLADVFVEEAHEAAGGAHSQPMEAKQPATVEVNAEQTVRDEEREMLAEPATSASDVRQTSEATQSEATQSEAAQTDDETQARLLGLDDAHSSFLRLLVTRASWTRTELAAAASHLELMLDGAIEQVNEASLDHWDEPLTDGDDPVEINQEVAQRLAA
ncbi:tellurite resistance TerB family protein [Paraburkholderia diazotrophica]|uniref:Tellurite resistance protein TerB n=1 Tax=Paraburkholderia diazotrophica TaxID=667676 RepID=A0A1H7E6G5_9BURK|nr:TerB N-terminal domain-containing protein [Paraburkholderia diazotrophica]SEK07672.1 Tellurite resistance protein TerB [Paraburkholderia diazotrophica]